MNKPRCPLANPSFFWSGQLLHLVLLAALLGGLWMSVDVRSLANRCLLGISARDWFILAWLVPILHQVYVWVAWRSELCFLTLTGRFGLRAFPLYRVVFFLLFLARPLSLLLLAIADRDSFEMSMIVRIAICILLGLPAIYAGYSVVRHFGISRAAGADHFDERYRSLPLVKKGIFRYTSNAMYTFAFFTFWIIAVAFASWSALVVAAFSHVYIWVHYYCVERPDMQLIYSSPED